MGDKLKILIVTDKFKGSLTALEAAESIKKGLLSRFNHLKIDILPMADGGDGTLDVIKNFAGGELKKVIVSDPLKRNIVAHYLVKGKLAYIEMAKCSGLQLLKPQEFDPSITTTFGLGEMIVAAVEDLKNSGEGEREIVIGIGGSATNDGGVGLLRAMGYRLTDKRGCETECLTDIFAIEGKEAYRIPDNIKLKVACDVNNPLLGKNGATMIYGPQKGADSLMIKHLEYGMENWAKVCQEYLGIDMACSPGAGAAGGTGFALMAFLKAEMIPGWRVLSQITDLEKRIENSDLVITGEGSVDVQSISGKLLNGVSGIAAKYSKPLWVYCGINNLSKNILRKSGVKKLFSIADIETDKGISIKDAHKYLEKISYDSATFLTNIQSNRQTD